MDHITVDFEELFQVISEMKHDGVSKATISIVESDDPDDEVPAFLVISAPSADCPGAEIEYDYIDAVSES